MSETPIYDRLRQELGEPTAADASGRARSSTRPTSRADPRPPNGPAVGQSLGPPDRAEGEDQAVIVAVELRRAIDSDPDVDKESVWWHAEWGPAGRTTSGPEDGSPDLGELVTSILDEIRSYWAGNHDRVRIEWHLGGVAPPGQTIESAVAETGVTLPTRPGADAP